MMKAAIALSLIIIFCPPGVSTPVFADSSGATYRVIAGEQQFTVEIADSRELHRKGLMYRPSLPISRGLLMVFKRDRKVPIWMKNMQLPLDVVWLSADGVVVDLKTLPVCMEIPCQIYQSEKSARFVLEVGAGQFPLNTDDKVEILDASGDSLLPFDSGQ